MATRFVEALTSKITQLPPLASIIQKRIRSELLKILDEQLSYQAAFYANYRKVGDPQKVKDSISELTIQEHKIQAQGDQLEQLYYLLTALHAQARRSEVVFDPTIYSTQTALSEPNSFPMQSSRKLPLTNIWTHFSSSISPALLDAIGHTLHVEKSSIPHPESGEGVFIQAEKDITPGTIIGLVPGIIYAKSEAERKAPKIFTHNTELPYLNSGNYQLNFEDPLFFPDYHFGKSIEKSLRDDNAEKPVEIPGHWVNPYAVGQFVNHPPQGSCPNVAFVDIQVPASFFPYTLMRYFPYSFYADIPRGWRKHQRVYQAVGLVAIEPISKGRTELFINYSSDRFADQFEPEWLATPPDGSLAQYLVKEEAYHEFSALSKSILRWSELSGTALDSVEKAQKDQELSKAMQDTRLFAEYYEKHRKN